MRLLQRIKNAFAPRDTQGRRRVNRKATASAVMGLVVAGGVGGGAVFTSRDNPSVPAGTANIWVDTNGGTCVDNASPVTYTDATACTPDAANDTCDNNDTVLWRNGSYGNVTITGSNGRSATCTMSAENTAADSVTFGILTTDGDWMTIRHMDSHVGETTHLGSGGCALCDLEGGSNVVFDDVNLWGKWAAGEISGGSVHATATNVTHQNSHVGTAGNTADRLCGSDDEPFRVSEADHVSFIGNTYHPFFGEAGCFHLETFRIWDTSDWVVFKNNWFDDNRGDSTGTISSSFGGCPPPTCPNNTNFKIIQNYFGDKSGGLEGYDFSTGLACVGNVVAYNYFKDQGAGFQDNCATETDGIYVGNMGYNPGGCVVSPGSGNHHNLWIASSHGTCTGNTWLSGAADTWTSYLLNADGWHLTASSPSINFGETTVCMAWTGGFDIEGDARTGNCDAGIDEYTG